MPGGNENVYNSPLGLDRMYEGVNNSPKTMLTANISASDTVIPVMKVDIFPNAPNLATIGNGDDAEVIRYEKIEGLSLTGCQRGYGKTQAKSWDLDTTICRAYTRYDHDTFKKNIETIESEVSNQKTHGATHFVGGADPINISVSQITDINDSFSQKNHQHDGYSETKIVWDYLENVPESFPPDKHAGTHGKNGSDPITIDYSQIQNAPTSLPVTPHADTHAAGGSDPLTIKKAQVSDFPTEMVPTAHADTHAAGGSDPLIITKAQISDFPTEMTPAKHADVHQKGGSDELTLDYSQIQNGPTTMTPTAHANSHKFGAADAITISKEQIDNFPTAMMPTGHKNTHKIGGSDALTPADIGAMSTNPIIIEMGGAPWTGGVIDFHFGNSTTDFTSRIGEFAQGMITIANDLFVIGRIFMNNGQLVKNGGFTNYGATLQPGASWNATTRQQTVNVPGSANSTNLLTGPDIGTANSYEEWCNCGVRCVVRSGNILTFQCEAIPSVAITVSILGG